MLLGARHVQLNGLYLPANLAVQQCRRMCVPLHLTTGDEAWPISNRGTTFLYKVFGRRFCIFTRHQLGKDFEASRVFISLTGDDRKLHGGTRFVYFRGGGDREEHDLCAVEMPWNLGNAPDARMFYQGHDGVPMMANEADRLFALGYPTKLNQMRGEERSEHIAMSQVLVWADRLDGDESDLPMIRLRDDSMVMMPRCGGDYDGFSGGPVFSISTASYAVEFRGIILRGGHDKLFFATAAWVNRLCKLALQHEPCRVIAA